MKQKFQILLFVTLLASCHNKFDQPPLADLPEGAELTVRSLKQRLSGSNSLYHFGTGDSTIYLTVTMDESSGNLYKQVYAQDKEGTGILLRLQESGGLYTGDKIRINLNKAWLICANSGLLIDSVSVATQLVKISSGNLVNPLLTSAEEIFSETNFKSERNFQSRLVTLTDVEFDAKSFGLTLANAIGKTALEHQLGKCGGQKISLRTGGLASFASKPVPQGHGSITGIVQQFNNDFTLILRNFNEMQMNGVTCGPPDTSKAGYYLYKDFDDMDLNSGNWMNVAVTGTTSWQASGIGQTSGYARIYNKNNGVYEACETWLVSPEINLSNTQQPIMTFMTANSSTASPLSLMVSEDYVSGSPSSATWDNIAFGFQKNSFTYYPSGDITLAAYKGKKVRIAFRYSGTAATGSIWDVDKIIVREKQ